MSILHETRTLALGRRAAAVVLGLTLALGACDTNSILEVPDPDVVSVPVFSDPSNLPAVHAGVLAEFARAVGGTQNSEGGQVLVSGLFSDELYHSGSFTTRQEIDARDVQDTNATNQTAFFWLQRARNHAEQAGELFAGSDEAGSESHAEVTALAGYTYVYFGENYCGGVPFSTIPFEGGPTVFGSAQTTDQILDRAIARFDDAMAMGPDADLTMMAEIGKARALLDKGEFAQAAQTVQGIPTTFQWDVAYSSNALSAYNAVWNLVNAEKRWSAAGSEGTNGLPFLTNEDPRTPTEFTGGGFTSSVPHYDQLAYTGPGSNIVLASGIEARLIEAEAALEANDRDTFFAMHNAARATMELPDLQDTGQTMDELVDLHFRERAYWLWLTSHRLGDLRRLVRQYGRSANSVYPIGPTVQNSSRGNQLDLPVPFTETNNPNYDPTMCDPTGA